MAETTDDEDKIIDASPRRRQEARERGQVAMSTELTVAALLAGWLACLTFAGGPLAATLAGGIARTAEGLASFSHVDLTAKEAAAQFAALTLPAAKSASLLILPMFALGILVSYGQIGFAFSPQAVGFDPNKVSPLAGWKKVASMRSVVRTALGIAKIGVIATTIVAVAMGQVNGVAMLGESDVGPVLAVTGHLAFKAVVAAIVAMLALASTDFFYQRWQLSKDLRMTKEEARQEHKQDEGDPHVKGRIRRLQREIAARRMMADVPNATVIVTNPTHYAVALKYYKDGFDERGRKVNSAAPRVVAKGVDLIAQRIKELGREAKVPLYEDVPLARALHARCEIGDEIPSELFTAVAEVLAYVYRVHETKQSA
ncbi:MAG TPA: EscU/YscU/HrcU family type III secretion system export apparatus switch protein [Planctomycetota bacterium]|nr:EscU/YscU/HrcU family type III secretion system export apparatus switch protein [Planctomycetota bacterium]